MALLQRIRSMIKNCHQQNRPPIDLLADRFLSVAQEARQVGNYTEAAKLELIASEVRNYSNKREVIQ